MPVRITRNDINTNIVVEWARFSCMSLCPMSICVAVPESSAVLKEVG